MLLSKVCRQRYLNGSPELLARNVLADNDTGALFVGASVHPENYRAIVAALRQPCWFRHYQGEMSFFCLFSCKPVGFLDDALPAGMKRLATEGRLSRPRGLNSGVLRQLRQRLRSAGISRELQGTTSKKRRRSLELSLQKLQSQRQQMRLDECGFGRSTPASL